ncbi:threonylcarbamoyl-AMP synthase [Winogradskyella sp. PC-19]|uniref:L-threonylcarbamoyladenylate synthase n=1 Tax=unclassified Winogradskyella TaxID=2615021 RepID=UPI000B3CF8E2|nr:MULTISPECIES: L-threonylcarbamoyladenylate synthase [unclassified Winogradskyella]ARV09974.1 threonylcarbamoyl-AMP synthase [Winogradskyella sp. PC-19]
MSIISKDIQKAVTLLNAEELVAIPTETVYGLAGNIFSKKAINSIFETKQRPFFNPLIVHIPSIDYLEKIVAHIPEKARLLAKAFWPGPITLVLKKKAVIPDVITAGKDTVAVRIPNHPTTLELLKQLDFPLAAPSANPFNRISPTTAEHVEGYFKNEIKMVLDGGACKSGIESTIIGFEDNEPIIYRLGSTSIEAIESIVGKIEVKNSTKKTEVKPEAPGMLAKHYAPTTKTILVDDLVKAISENQGLKIGVLSLNSSFKNNAVKQQISLSVNKNLQEAASHLYDALHKLDAANLDIIIVQRFPNHDLGKSINDRLERATK